MQRFPHYILQRKRCQYIDIPKDSSMSGVKIFSVYIKIFCYRILHLQKIMVYLFCLDVYIFLQHMVYEVEKIRAR